MFRSIKKLFITTIGFVDWGALISSNPLKIVSMSNQKCRVKLTMVNINSNEPLFHPYSILVNKCSGSCNDINNPYTKLCIPHVKNMNNNLLSKNNETCCVLAWNLCVCKYRLDVQVFVVIGSTGIVINADVNVKSWLIKAVVMMDLFGILAHGNVINQRMLVDTWIIWIVNVERGWLIN